MPLPQTLIVQSPQNARVKALRAALLRPLRTGEDGLVGIEGIHLLEEALRSGLQVETILVRAGSESLLERIGLGTAEVLSVAEKTLRGAMSTQAPQPLAALVRAPSFLLSDVFQTQTPLVAVLDGLQDPGNLGTLLRSAEAFGASGVIALPGTVSVWNAKCVRASAGSVFRLPVVAAELSACVGAFTGRGVRSLATVVTGAASLAETDLRGACALWIGNEGAGLAPETVKHCDSAVTIAYPGVVESLNAAVAASVLLYEASRQRGAR